MNTVTEHSCVPSTESNKQTEMSKSGAEKSSLQGQSRKMGSLKNPKLPTV